MKLENVVLTNQNQTLLKTEVFLKGLIELQSKLYYTLFYGYSSVVHIIFKVDINDNVTLFLNSIKY